MTIRRTVTVAVALLALAIPAFAHARLAYVKTVGGAEWIYLAADDGSGAVKSIKGSNPALSPDGTLVALSRFDSSGPHLIIARADLSGEKAPPLACIGPAVWSPDSRQLACWEDELTQTLKVVDVVTDAITSIGTSQLGAGASFSPDSTRIVWGKQVNASRNDLYVTTIATVASGRIVRNGGFPIWSATDRIAYAHLKRRGGASYPVSNVWVVRPNGSGAHALTRIPTPDPLLSGLTPIAWSQDGKRLIAGYGGQDTDDVWTIDLRRHRARDLTGRFDGVWATAISRDGRYVLAQTGGPEASLAQSTVVRYTFGGRSRRTLAAHAGNATWTR